MAKNYILVTGSSGEIGKALIQFLLDCTEFNILGLDLKAPLANSNQTRVTYVTGDILDSKLIEQLESQYAFDSIFHLAAVLSTGGEKDPEKTQRTNVDGSLNLLQLARRQTEALSRPVRFMLPSTIAVYGVPEPLNDKLVRAISEDDCLQPITMYGINKLYVEHLGRYFEKYYRFLSRSEDVISLDFRCVRLPGVLSAHTVPNGGTSDYGPEMLHSAARGVPYECFVTPQARLPFMAMPDAVKALTSLWQAPKKNLTRNVYNVNAFSITAEEIAEETLRYFPHARISYKTQSQRLAIVQSWPDYINDKAARTDWNWAPDYERQKAFSEYLVPGIKQHYEVGYSEISQSVSV